MCKGTLFTVEKILPQAGLELRTARSVGQRFTHCATGAPFFSIRVKSIFFFDINNKYAQDLFLLHFQEKICSLIALPSFVFYLTISNEKGYISKPEMVTE